MSISHTTLGPTRARRAERQRRAKGGAHSLQVCKRLPRGNLRGATRSQRIEALRAGADELWGQPMDPEEFRLRLAAQLRAKSDADRAREEGLLDDRSRLWNDRGLLRRAEELLAATIRDRSAIGVAVVDIDGDGLRDDWVVGDRVAEGLRRWARLSDAVGRIGTARFGVVAPRTGRTACARLG